jgi:hypothetical protein
MIVGGRGASPACEARRPGGATGDPRRVTRGARPLARRVVVASCAIAALAAIGCGGARERTPTSAAPDTAAAIERARAAAAGLGGELSRRLFASLDSAGPAASMRMCSEVAQGMTAAHAKEGVWIRRVSDRNRNPANAPDSIEAGVIAHWRSLEAAGRSPAESLRIGRDPSGAARIELLRPVLLGERCVVCHGAPEQIPNAVRTLLAERYPRDRATGFVPGELRGAVSVRVALEDQR